MFVLLMDDTKALNSRSYYRVVEKQDVAPLVVHEEEEGEDGDDEAGDDEHHHDQAAVHLPLLHHQTNIKYTDKDFKDTACCVS